MKTRNLVRGGFAVVVLSVLTACTTGLQLQPAPAAQSAGDRAARTTVDNVEVTAYPDGWPGGYAVSSAVTPIRVRIQNDADFPVRLRYEDLRLVTSRGDELNALAPFRVEGTVAHPLLAPDVYTPITSPVFDWDDFDVAPYYAGVYPGLVAWDGDFVYDPYYYDGAYDFWLDTGLPSTAMLQRALPEGVLEPGGKVEGFVYFKRPALKQGETVTLRFNVVNANSHDDVATAKIPFVAEDMAS